MKLRILFLSILSIQINQLTAQPQKVAIIGGGVSGLVSALLLQKDRQVTIFEKQDRIGGHAQTLYLTIKGKPVLVELGAEFFCDKMFPHFNALLAYLQVPVKKYPLTYTFFSTENNSPRTIVLPPCSYGRCAWWMFMPHNFFDMVQLKKIISHAQKIIDAHDFDTILEPWIESLGLTTHFKNNIFYPLLAAGWGVSIEDIKTFVAYDILIWLVYNVPEKTKMPKWNEIRGGMSYYINALEHQLYQTKICKNCTIENITYENNLYIITLADGKIFSFDQLIIATPAYEAVKLLKNIPDAAALKNELEKIEYFPTKIAIHNDIRYMPAKKLAWSVINVRYDGSYGQLTTYKYWHSKTPIFRSWITFDYELPRNLYALIDYKHAKVNKAYFEVQKKLKEFQGKNNLWIAGLYTTGIDTHESAIISAMNIADKLVPESRMLKILKTI